MFLRKSVSVLDESCCPVDCWCHRWFKYKSSSRHVVCISIRRCGDAHSILAAFKSLLVSFLSGILWIFRACGNHQPAFLTACACACREAKQLLQRVGQLPRGLKPLGEIISEYVALKEAHLQREQLLASNAALRDVFHVIESHAAAVSQAAALQDPTLRVRAHQTRAPASK